jgi:acetolactate decarboxylase
MPQPDKSELNQSRLYLCAPVNALVEGIYTESIPLTQVKQHGDFGLGTFDHLDGEMVMIDGVAYQITADGHVAVVEDHISTPFACVTFYKTHSTDEIERDMTYEEFLDWLRSLLLSPNMFYALRIEGHFAHMKVRSVPKQENYRPLVEVAHDQPVFNFYEVEGTLAGFFTPSFMSSINVPGLHLHFLSNDLQHGGHLLECTPRKLRVGVQFISKLELSLPMTLDYLTADFNRDITSDLNKVEK